MNILATASKNIQAPPDIVYEFLTIPETFPGLFRGYGPIPAMRGVELLDGAERLVPGVVRHVFGEDGSVLKERIDVMDAPSLYTYTILGGLTPPLAWLVSGAAVGWRFHRLQQSTRIVWHYKWQVRSFVLAPLVFIVARGFLQPAMRRFLSDFEQALSRKYA